MSKKPSKNSERTSKFKKLTISERIQKCRELIYGIKEEKSENVVINCETIDKQMSKISRSPKVDECFGDQNMKASKRLYKEEKNKYFGSEIENGSEINENSNNIKHEKEVNFEINLDEIEEKFYKNPPRIRECRVILKDIKMEKSDEKFNNLASGSHKKIHNKTFGCQICGKKYPTKFNLLKHIRNMHERPKSYKCDICKFGFNTKAHLERHQKVHMKNRPKPFKCSKCNNYATDTKFDLKKHLKTHERIIKRCNNCNTILYKNRIHDCRLDCKYCEKKFSHKETVADHIKNCHAHETERLLYKCDICGLKLYQKNGLRIHMDVKHIDVQVQNFTCDLDGKTFKIKKHLDQHMKSHLPPVKCDFCHKKVNIRYLKGHIKSLHTGIKPPKKQPRKKPNPKTKSFQCRICLKMLSTKHGLNNHISNHNKTIKCKFCQKLFGTQSKLNAHIRNYHENTAEIICNICSKKFLRQTYLKIHLKTHDSNRVMDLKCTQCDYATDNKHSFKAHLNFHKMKNAEIAAIKNPHKCPQCPAVKKTQKLLNTHIRRVHPKDLFECDICGKKIKEKYDVLLHFRKFHNIGS